jgi:hypothetical protein
MAAKMATKTATCSCGELRAEVTAAPLAVVACHCAACQRRTGAPFGVGAYYNRTHVKVSGVFKPYVRKADSGRLFTTHFCPTCGTSLFWESELKPDEVGIAVGTFADPDFEPPARSVWEQTRHRWVHLALTVPRFLRGRDSGPISE